MINTDLKEPFTFLNNRPLFASISGGKDSTAMGLFLKENNIKFTPVFLETGWEHPSTYEYIESTLTELFGEFKVLRNEKYFEENSEWSGGMEQLVKRKKAFPNNFMKFCTSELKVIPIMSFYVETFLKTGLKPINCVGIRAEESRKRSTYLEHEEQDEASVWRPLINFTEQEVIDLHHKYNVPPNPLYIRGYTRVGCYPCIYARKHEIRHLSFSDPQRIEYIRDLEKKVTDLRNDEQKATFFKSRVKDKKYMNIHEIVGWSRQKKNKVLDDLEEIEESGCMRWGLCERTLREGDQLSLFGEERS